MSNLTKKEVIEIINIYGTPEALSKKLLTEKDIYKALGSKLDRGSYKYRKKGGKIKTYAKGGGVRKPNY